MDKAARAIFENYFSVQAAKADALTFGQKRELVGLLRHESHGEGKVPVAPDQVVRLPIAHPAMVAVLSGQSVSVTGKEVKTAPRAGLAGLSTPAKLGILAIPVAVAVIVGVLIVWVGSIVLCGEPLSFAHADGRDGDGDDDGDCNAPPRRGEHANLSHGHAVYVSGGEWGWASLGEDVNAPASVEFAGYSFGLSVSALRSGVWEPKGPEYLAGAELRRVVAVPYTDELNAAASRIVAGTDIRLRLRSGEMVAYRVTAVKRVRLNEIELLTDKTPSLVIVLYGERSTERTAIIADAVQQPDGVSGGRQRHGDPDCGSGAARRNRKCDSGGVEYAEPGGGRIYASRYDFCLRRQSAHGHATDHHRLSACVADRRPKAVRRQPAVYGLRRAARGDDRANARTADCPWRSQRPTGCSRSAIGGRKSCRFRMAWGMAW